MTLEKLTQLVAGITVAFIDQPAGLARGKVEQRSKSEHTGRGDGFDDRLIYTFGSHLRGMYQGWVLSGI